MSIVDDITSAFGYQDAFPGTRDSDGIIEPGGQPYRYVCVVKGGNKTYYEGVASLQEATERSLDIIDESVKDPESVGVWVVMAIIDTYLRVVVWPRYDVRVESHYNTGLDTLI